MWKTWFRTAWRNFYKHRSFSLLNIAGLSSGITCVLAILLYVLDEFKYDRFHEKADRIYRVNVQTNFGGVQQWYNTTSTPLGEAIQRDISSVEQAGRIFGRQATIQILEDSTTLLPDSKYMENNFFFADQEILDMLTFNFIAGSPSSALTQPNQLIINKKIAIKYFGSVDKAMGKMIQFEEKLPLVIAGVFEDFPIQSSYSIELVAHFENYFKVESEGVQEFLRRDWMYNPVTTLVLLNQDADPTSAQEQIEALMDRYGDKRVQESVFYQLQPLLKVHLHSPGGQSEIRNVYIFSAIGGIILLIACINFINLATVHSLRRAKEIGLRKVMGALNRSLMYQFLIESTTLVLCSTVIGVFILILLLPQLRLISGKEFDISSLTDPSVFILMALVVLITGLVAGLYPAAYITRFDPVASLKNLKSGPSNKGLILRRALVIIQFTSSLILIMVTLVISSQMEFIRNRPLGFQREFMITTPLFSANINSILGGGVESDLRSRMNSFENEVLKIPAVEAITLSSVLPGAGAVPALVVTDKIRDTDNVFVPVISVDYDFIDTYKIQLIAGRNFDKKAGTDHLQAIIANEEATRVFGFTNPQEALGYQVEVLGKKALIIGVIKNYHFEGLQQAIRPLLLEVNVSKFTTFSFRLNGTNATQRTIDQLQSVWNSTFPEKVFHFEFLDQQLADGYGNESRFGKLINIFTAIAIFISGLGMLGLTAYVGHQRRKEAAIRKTLGASTRKVFFTLSTEFMVVLAISVALAIPSAYLLADNWLSNFAYRVSIDWLPFVISVVATGTILFLTTAYQTYRTATVNPVNVLRNE